MILVDLNILQSIHINNMLNYEENFIIISCYSFC